MSFPATVFNVLIASPSDVPNERRAIADCLHSWNALNSRDTGKVLLPVMWESHSAPSMADRPQEIINEQMVRNCDMLIGVFWTRLGSPTGRAKSGTIEEINFFMRQKKPAMLYFSKSPVDPDHLNIEQWNELKKFKDNLMDKGLLEQYANTDDLIHKLSRQITITMREINVTPLIDTKAVKRAIAKEEEHEADLGDKGDLYLAEYTAKSFIVRGDAKKWAENLKNAGGSWIKTRDGIWTWCFSKKKTQEVADILNISSIISPLNK